MLTLAIDSASEACSVALFDNDEPIAGDFRLLGRGHAEMLVPMIAGLPGNGHAGRVAVSLGPGSFTGVRVGLAAAQALAFAWGAKLVGFPTLSLIAAMARAERGAQPVTVATTGGHGEWFVQSFDEWGAAASELSSLPPDRAASEATAHMVAGNQAGSLIQRRGWGEAIDLLPDARTLNCLPGTSLTDDVRPLYGRAPDARLPGTKGHKA